MASSSSHAVIGLDTLDYILETNLTAVRSVGKRLHRKETKTGIGFFNIQNSFHNTRTRNDRLLLKNLTSVIFQNGCTKLFA